jgi:hypothetical protein
LHVSFAVQGLPSLQLSPAREVTEHDAVPLQVDVVQAVLVHVIEVPRQVPAEQVSEWVHAFPSSQLPPARHAHVPLTLVH